MKKENFELSRENNIKLSDGRLLNWYEDGPENGTPLLFCTGAGMSGSMGFGLNELKELNIRLISPDRPGLGKSTSHPEKNLNSWCEDVKQLFTHLDLFEVHTLGFSQGSVFSYALAAKNMVKTLTIVSGQDDFCYEQTRSLLKSDVLHFIKMVQSKDLGFIQQFSKNIDAKGFLELIISMSGKDDQNFYQSEPFFSQYKTCLKQGFASGPDGYVGDLLNAMSDWGKSLENLNLPVHLWYGGKDTSTVHSPDMGKILSKRIARSKLHFYEKEGGSLLWTKSAEILKTLTDKVDN